MDIINKIEWIIETTTTGDIAQNDAKSTLMGMRYRKKKKKSKLTGKDIITYEDKNEYNKGRK